jgi:glutathione synthase/RimK-type ligase-like ATP-grasp enzyme
MILVVSSKKVYAAKKLRAEAKKRHVGLEILSMEDLVARKFKIDPKKYETLYIRSPYLNSSPKYFPQIIKLAKEFKKAGKKVVDASIVQGKIGQGKWLDYQALKKAGLSIPKTQILNKKTIPKAWPFILKWIYGFKAKNVFYIDNQKDFNQVFGKYPKGELLVQEFVKAEYEYKVITVGYKALPVILRFQINKNGFRTDFDKYKVITRRHSEGVQPTEESQNKKEILHSVQDDAVMRMIKLAERASKTLGRELAKVDILEAKGKLYILEVNRFPGLDSFEELTKYNVSKEFLRYLTSVNRMR